MEMRSETGRTNCSGHYGKQSLYMELKVNIIEYFFFQAEDGIRDTSVTGVQTCALPISEGSKGSLLRNGWFQCFPV